ncbi:site-specific integrase [Roseibaca sp. Y0-43]|uniref:site-specific integrase n=1 Tax=Roseibaca sp. Y0-43 TaxID=2816854 RepID=UPI001D0CB396|nr:tyrosine-type recombinase/integrase [Roseibaca sp. Y0-43]MCC1482324.1 tyrosine-type recombinase/integrase [Roseibaca sp. Y0-43]
MTSLKRDRNGDWFARKGIPKDIRDAYRAAYGKSQEERFRRDSGLPSGRAKREFLDWLAEIEDRIDRIRNASSVQTLTQRQMHALIGRWYAEFTQERTDPPETAEEIEHIYDAYEQVVESGCSTLGNPEDFDESEERTPQHAARVRAFVAAHSDIDAFLISEGVGLSEGQRCELIDALENDFVAALGVRRRRALGDFGEDTRLRRFPDVSDLARVVRKEKLAGWTAWQAFEAWVAERKPAASTVNRWRGVFQALDVAHEGKDVALFTAEDAINWKNSLITEGRGTRTVNEIWLSAARRVFGWVVEQKKIPKNPFEGVKVAGPAKPPKTRQDEFNDAEIKLILNASLAPMSPRIGEQLRAAYRWVPWICAYTGARVGEITQLRKQDFQRHRSGFWFITITPEAGAVKGDKFREVVLHEHLLEQGLIDFVADSNDGYLFCKPASDTPIDPLNPPRPPHVIARTKLADWVRKQGVEDPRIRPNHAWRHTFKRRAARAGIEQRLRDGICGHSSGSVGAIYETPSLEDIAEAISRFPRYDV